MTLPAGIVAPFRVSRDGQRFLLMVGVNPPQPFRVLVNWLPPAV
jgi:hypothetical protein